MTWRPTCCYYYIVMLLMCYAVNLVTGWGKTLLCTPTVLSVLVVVFAYEHVVCYEVIHSFYKHYDLWDIQPTLISCITEEEGDIQIPNCLENSLFSQIVFPKTEKFGKMMIWRAVVVNSPDERPVRQYHYYCPTQLSVLTSSFGDMYYWPTTFWIVWFQQYATTANVCVSLYRLFVLPCTLPRKRRKDQEDEFSGDWGQGELTFWAGVAGRHYSDWAVLWMPYPPELPHYYQAFETVFCDETGFLTGMRQAVGEPERLVPCLLPDCFIIFYKPHFPKPMTDFILLNLQTCLGDIVQCDRKLLGILVLFLINDEENIVSEKEGECQCCHVEKPEAIISFRFYTTPEDQADSMSRRGRLTILPTTPWWQALYYYYETFVGPCWEFYCLFWTVQGNSPCSIISPYKPSGNSFPFSSVILPHWKEEGILPCTIDRQIDVLLLRHAI